MQRRLRIFCATAAAAGLALGATWSAFAHEHRQVGALELGVGWAVEPAFAGQMNGVEVMLSVEAAPAAEEHADEHGTEAPATPLAGLAGDLQVEVTHGSATTTLALDPDGLEPGRYVAALLPTEAGDYRFRVFGTVGATAVDETFDTADGEIDAVRPIADVRFPPVADAADGGNRTSAPAAIGATRNGVPIAVADAVAEARQAAQTVRGLAWASLAVGIAALGLALVALRGRRAAP